MFVTSIVLAVLAQAAPAAQAKTELAGVVIDAGGKPVAGALVLLSSFHRIGGKDASLARTTTDAQGRFRHRRPPRTPPAQPRAGRSGPTGRDHRSACRPSDRSRVCLFRARRSR